MNIFTPWSYHYYLPQGETGRLFDFFSVLDVKKVMDKNPSKLISLSVENMLKTGRLLTQTGLDLQQRAGYTVQAERLNYLHFILFF
ncbi:hypothetical protein SLE2022_066430 [Rubroshorea leprosula]